MTFARFEISRGPKDRTDLGDFASSLDFAAIAMTTRVESTGTMEANYHAVI